MGATFPCDGNILCLEFIRVLVVISHMVLHAIANWGNWMKINMGFLLFVISAMILKLIRKAVNLFWDVLRIETSTKKKIETTQILHPYLTCVTALAGRNRQIPTGTRL